MTASAFSTFRAGARGQPVTQEHSQLPDTTSPGTSVTQLFPFQSYFSTTLLQQALLQQSKNQPIVDAKTPAVGAASPMVVTNTAGYTFGLHPSSQTPVAVLPLVGGQPTSPQPIILKPGQIYRPTGRPLMKNGNFSGLNWGIPFGWLGGGVATLYIFPSPDADVAWPGNPEVIFHRQRMQIYQPGDLAALAAAPFNWPMRFPWPHAIRGADDVDQSGEPTIAVEPTSVFMSLRTGSLAAAARMRILVQGSNDFDLDEDGDPVLTPVRFQDYIWGSYAVNGGGGDLGTNYPMVELPSPISQVAVDDGGVVLVDMSGTAALNGLFVDVVRYGRL